MPDNNFLAALVELVSGKLYHAIFQQSIVQVRLKFLLDIKDSFNNPLDLKKRRSRFVIYKLIDMRYDGNNDDKNGILEKLELPTKEEMQDEH
jgi:hypothetical protein